jgi:hypothetical protein
VPGSGTRTQYSPGAKPAGRVTAQLSLLSRIKATGRCDGEVGFGISPPLQVVKQPIA